MLRNDTIAAIATAPGEGAISIVRVSGPKSLEVADAIFSCRAPPPSRRRGGTFVFGHILDGQGRVLDEALLLIMRAPHSYTREDAIEIQGHGGVVMARRILERVVQAGARVAEPGEFTLRAFLNGRLDLAQAEAVADLIRAKTERAASAALAQLEGGLSRRVNELYDRLLFCATQIEASLDFADQELPDGILDPVAQELSCIIRGLRDVLSTWEEGRLLRDGALVVIAGRPNAGKSTLLNAMLGKDRAIVSPVPGTTRDTLHEPYVLNGIPITLVDTAGIRSTECEIEQEGIRRAVDILSSADVCIYLVDATLGITADDREAWKKISSDKRLLVANKVDLVENPTLDDAEGEPFIKISAKTGEGLNDLRAAISRKLERTPGTHAPHAVISARHRALLETALVKSEQALREMADGHPALDLAALNVREAVESLGAITGRVYYEDLLNSIFSQFCIGK